MTSTLIKVIATFTVFCTGLLGSWAVQANATASCEVDATNSRPDVCNSAYIRAPLLSTIGWGIMMVTNSRAQADYAIVIRNQEGHRYLLRTYFLSGSQTVTKIGTFAMFYPGI